MCAYHDLAFPETRENVLLHARQFAPHMGVEYAKNRNFVVPGHRFVSRLAPANRVRLITEKELVQIALHQFTTPANCEKFLQEVYWRSYWRSWLELRPEIWQRYQSAVSKTSSHLDATQKKRIQRIESGDTGITVLDQFVCELLSTGYIHNHARMWFAAYWIHVEQLPWELGSDFFERNLICACPAANTLSWRWVAGLHTPGKAYLARRSNLEKYCDAAYLGDYKGLERLENPSTRVLPHEEVPPPVHPEFELEVQPSAGRTGLWISEDDLAPETSLLGEIPVQALSASLVAAPEKSTASNGKRRLYRQAAIRDVVQRAQHHWNAYAETLESENSELLAEQLIAWAKNSKLDTVLTLKPFVGPSGDALPSLKSGLNQAGIELKLLRRKEDAELLPSAKRGFFNFWEACKKQQF